MIYGEFLRLNMLILLKMSGKIRNFFSCYLKNYCHCLGTTGARWGGAQPVVAGAHPELHAVIAKTVVAIRAFTPPRGNTLSAKFNR
jgi:hypothetical protein